MVFRYFKEEGGGGVILIYGTSQNFCLKTETSTNEDQTEEQDWSKSTPEGLSKFTSCTKFLLYVYCMTVKLRWCAHAYCLCFSYLSTLLKKSFFLFFFLKNSVSQINLEDQISVFLKSIRYAVSTYILKKKKFHAINMNKYFICVRFYYQCTCTCMSNIYNRQMIVTQHQARAKA